MYELCTIVSKYYHKKNKNTSPQKYLITLGLSLREWEHFGKNSQWGVEILFKKILYYNWAIAMI